MATSGWGRATRTQRRTLVGDAGRVYLDTEGLGYVLVQAPTAASAANVSEPVARGAANTAEPTALADVSARRPEVRVEERPKAQWTGGHVGSPRPFPRKARLSIAVTSHTASTTTRAQPPIVFTVDDEEEALMLAAAYYAAWMQGRL